jgi:hypothetical protein
MEQKPLESIVLTNLFEAKDEIDADILENSTSMIIGLQVSNFILTDKNLFDNYFENIIAVAGSLFKANSHRRKYHVQKDKFLSDFKNRCLQDGVNTDRAINSPDLISEVDGALTQIKAALDSLAKTLNPIFGLKLHGWNKENKESGRKIVNVLERNICSTLKDRVEPLKLLIEKNIPWISYLVSLRDDPNHHGGLKNITNVTYRQTTQEVVPPYILHNNFPEEVGIFLERSLEDIIEFVHLVINHSLSAKVGPNLIIVKNETKEFPPYRWAIIKK